ncbi:MAG: TfoX/Sxy family protein [Pseudomonadota bacterium]
MTVATDTPVARLRNLGPRSAAWLAEVGIDTEADLRHIGPMAAYAKVKALRPQDASLNLLWSLQAAVLDMRWNELPSEVKDALRRKLAE